jgi:thiol-disulfide isomerase/thioredoxin
MGRSQDRSIIRFALCATRAFVLVASLLATATLEAAPVSDPLLHKLAPVFVRNDLENHPVDLAAYRGRVVLLTFWATWCAPCRIEMPRFIAWQRQYASRGLQIVGVSMDDDPAPVRKLGQSLHVNYPILMGDEELGGLYGGIMGLPVTYLIDRDGTVSTRFKGETSLRSMELEIERLLRRP